MYSFTNKKPNQANSAQQQQPLILAESYWIERERTQIHWERTREEKSENMKGNVQLGTESTSRGRVSPTRAKNLCASEPTRVSELCRERACVEKLSEKWWRKKKGSHCALGKSPFLWKIRANFAGRRRLRNFWANGLKGAFLFPMGTVFVVWGRSVLWVAGMCWKNHEREGWGEWVSVYVGRPPPLWRRHWFRGGVFLLGRSVYTVMQAIHEGIVLNSWVTHSSARWRIRSGVSSSSSSLHSAQQSRVGSIQRFFFLLAQSWSESWIRSHRVSVHSSSNKPKRRPSKRTNDDDDDEEQPTNRPQPALPCFLRKPTNSTVWSGLCVHAM